MFHSIRPAILERMHFLEQIDARDRLDGTPRLQRLRQIPPETGQFLALLAASAPQGRFSKSAPVRAIPHSGWRLPVKCSGAA